VNVGFGRGVYLNLNSSVCQLWAGSRLGR